MRSQILTAAAATLVLSGCDETQQSTDSLSSLNYSRSAGSEYSANVTLVAHIVREGESLSTIGKRYNMDWRDIAAQNNMGEPFSLQVGQELRFQTRSWSPQAPERNDYSQVTSGADVGRNSFIHDLSIAIPALSLSHMPLEAKSYLNGMNQAVLAYCERNGLKRTGAALCGQGVCGIMTAISDELSWLPSALDLQFTNKAVYSHNFGSSSRDAFKIRQVLEYLSTRADSGWVRLKLKDLNMPRGYVENYKSEGLHYLPTALPGGTVLLYDADPNLRGKGAGGKANGHVEFVAERDDGEKWFAFTAFTPVHGGSQFCRDQFDRHMNGKVCCYAFVLVTPEIKHLWYRNQSGR